jgi:hypothetical protein
MPIFGHHEPGCRKQNGKAIHYILPRHYYNPSKAKGQESKKEKGLHASSCQ